MRSKTLELIALFGVTPVILLIVRSNGIRIAPLPLLWIASIVCVCLLKGRRSRERGSASTDVVGRGRSTRSNLFETMVAMIVCSGLLLVLYPLITTSPMFEFPRERPIVWMVVLCLYPLLSVIPQGIIFRRWFVSRYSDGLGTGWSMIIIGALCFGFSHVLFGNPVAPVITAIGGVLFLRTFLRSGSGWLADLEHAVLGNVAFTIGYGQWLYSGANG
ncbi:MAG: hypothetical protein CMJ33_08635 [Phycisphaerae bacterium]|nr:hypothetical protein [Phycisphaerae bacterium]